MAKIRNESRLFILQNILLQTRDGVDYCVQCSEFGDARPNGGKVDKRTLLISSYFQHTSMECLTHIHL